MKSFLPPLRPPGARPEQQFTSLCIRCGRCVESCPHQTLVLRGGLGPDRHTPEIKPLTAPCQLCMKCVASCPTGALDPACDSMEKPRIGKAHILKNACHNYTNGPMCWTCYDRCPLRGKGMVLSNGFLPAVADLCAGCGVCAYVCPQKAVLIVPVSSNYVPPDAAPGADNA